MSFVSRHCRQKKPRNVKASLHHVHLSRHVISEQADPEDMGRPVPRARRRSAAVVRARSPDNAMVGGGSSSTARIFRSASPGRCSARGTVPPVCGRLGNGRLEFDEDRPHPWVDYTIGCTLLTEPFFRAEKDWNPQPEDWAPSIGLLSRLVRLQRYSPRSSGGGDMTQ